MSRRIGTTDPPFHGASDLQLRAAGDLSAEKEPLAMCEVKSHRDSNSWPPATRKNWPAFRSRSELDNEAFSRHAIPARCQAGTEPFPTTALPERRGQLINARGCFRMPARGIGASRVPGDLPMTHAYYPCATRGTYLRRRAKRLSGDSQRVSACHGPCHGQHRNDYGEHDDIGGPLSLRVG